MMQFGHLILQYGKPFVSDHAPMLIPIRTTMNNNKVPFRFFNVWADHSSFLQIVEEEWANNKTSSRMKNIWLKLKTLKPKFQQLNAKEYKGITEKIDQSRIALKDIQAQLAEQYTDALVDQEKNCLQ